MSQRNESPGAPKDDAVAAALDFIDSLDADDRAALARPDPDDADAIEHYTALLVAERHTHDTVIASVSRMRAQSLARLSRRPSVVTLGDLEGAAVCDGWTRAAVRDGVRALLLLGQLAVDERGRIDVAPGAERW